MKTALIFDFGGVLMKTTSQAPRHQWDDQLGLSHGSVERIVHGSESWRLAQIGAIAVEDYWADVGRQLGLSSEQVTQLEHDFFSADWLDQDLIASIRKYRADGHMVALLSNDSRALRPKLEALGIAELFKPLVISAVIGLIKPDPRAYSMLLGQMGVPASEAIFIDDMPTNIQGAANVGLRGILYSSGMDLDEALRPYLT